VVGSHDFEQSPLPSENQDRYRIDKHAKKNGKAREAYQYHENYRADTRPDGLCRMVSIAYGGHGNNAVPEGVTHREIRFEGAVEPVVADGVAREADNQQQENYSEADRFPSPDLPIKANNSKKHLN
jgi:hypothetical protein